MPYRRLCAELKEFKEQLQNLLSKGFIIPSDSPCGGLVKNGTMSMCIDYRKFFFDKILIIES